MNAPDDLVGEAGFEPTTLYPPGRCATRLRYTPMKLLTHATGDFLIGRRDKTRTCDLLVPNEALYQTELHSDET